MRKKKYKSDPFFAEFVRAIIRKNRTIDLDFKPNFSGFFAPLLLTND